MMHKRKVVLISLLSAIILYGCSSANVEKEPIEVKSSQESLEKEVIEKVPTATPTPSQLEDNTEITVDPLPEENKNEELILPLPMQDLDADSNIQNFEFTPVDASRLSDTFNAEIELEGMKDTYQAKTYSSPLGYQLNYDIDRFTLEVNDSNDFFRAENPNPDMYPYVFVYISHLKDDHVEQNVITLKNTLAQYVPDVKLEVTESSIGDYPATRITLRSGQEWNSTISHYYLFKTDNSSYLIMTQYFLEAEEGYGARIEAMLSSFQEN